MDKRDKTNKIKENEYKGIPMVLVGMKCDLEHKRQVNKQEAKKLALSLSCPFFEACSTPTLNINVQEIFRTAIVNGGN